MRVCLIVVTVVLASAAPLSAQSLADVARKEGERRQGAQQAPKTYTNKDLKPTRAAEPAAPADGQPAADTAAAGAKPSPGAGSAPPADATADAAKAPDKATGDAAAGDTSREVKDQAYWSKRIAGLREQLSRDETYLDALQSRINALTMDFVNRDDPIQRDQIERDRTRALTELERLKKTVEQDRAAITDLEEEARRAGVPPGWLR
jgi:hypothetical protein